jgi:ribosomal peptide maturation radical SAM protein 1
MPWHQIKTPSIQLGILKPVLERRGIKTACRSHSLTFMDFLAARRIPFSYDEYNEVGDENFGVGLGDWIFAVPPFRPWDAARDQAYLAYLRQHGVRETLIQKAYHLRALVPEFLQGCFQDTLRAGPRIVGFTSMFSQNAASLGLAKMLKAADPSIKIVMGGANCQGEMGAALFRCFPQLDAVVRGEGELVFPTLVQEWLEGSPVSQAPGLCHRDGGEEFVVEHSALGAVPMDDVPPPDYDEYFARLATHRLREEIEPAVLLPVESSRGCWWGQKAHCTFCGLNGATMDFRSKSPDRFHGELLALAARYRKLNFLAVDNILDFRYFASFLPKLRESRCDLHLFYEIKSNLKKHHLRLMREAGLREIQPGIETFSNPILKLMRKGTTGLQNIRLLKWCMQFGIEVWWNILYGLPGEPPEEYERMADLMPSLTHLKPPRFIRLNIDRFSPYHTKPADHGLQILGPARFYRHIYDVSPADLADLAYCFEARHLDGRDPETYVGRCRQMIDDWQRLWPQSAGTLSYRRGPGFLLLSDRRPNLPKTDRVLDEEEAAIFLACDGGASPAAIQRHLKRKGHGEIGVHKIKNLLDDLARARFLYEEEGRYLSLALRANVNEIIKELEAGESEVESAGVGEPVASSPPENVRIHLELAARRVLVQN